MSNDNMTVSIVAPLQRKRPSIEPINFMSSSIQIPKDQQDKVTQTITSQSLSTEAMIKTHSNILVGTQVTHSQPNPPLSFKNEEFEFEQLGQILENFREKYFHFILNFRKCQQDLHSSQTMLSKSEDDLRRERNNVQRANRSSSELYDNINKVLQRINEFGAFKNKLKEKGEMIDSLVDSLKEALNKHSQKIKSLQLELESEKARYEGVKLKNEEQSALNHKIQKEFDQFRKDSMADLEKRDNEISALHLEIKRLQDQNEEFNQNISQLRSTLHDMEIQQENLKSEFHEKLQLALDKLVDLLNLDKNILNEKCDFQENLEHILGFYKNQNHTIISNLEAKVRELTDKHEDLSQKYIDSQSQLTTLKKQGEHVNAQIKASDQEISSKTDLIQKLEKRITEQQIESGSNAAKLADLQKLRIVANIAKDYVLEGQTFEDIEYEDLRSIFSERTSHISCQSKISSLITELENNKKKQVKMEATLKDQLKLVSEKNKEHVRKIENLEAELKKLKNQKLNVDSPIPGKSIENLIELIERDTQETKTAINQPITVLTPRNSRKPSSRSSGGRFRKRSPVSNQSEMDLWSVFAKHS